MDHQKAQVEYDRIMASPRRTPADSNWIIKLQNTEMLERVDVDVLVTLPVVPDEVGEPSPHHEVVWEHHQSVGHTMVSEGGALALDIQGFDADGDFCEALRRVIYPAGRWLKLTSVQTPVPNPHYVEEYMP